MKIKIHNVPGYSHEYSVSETHVLELDSGVTEYDYRLGLNKHLVVTKRHDTIIKVEFNNSKKVVKLPESWFEIIN